MVVHYCRIRDFKRYEYYCNQTSIWESKTYCMLVYTIKHIPIFPMVDGKYIIYHYVAFHSIPDFPVYDIYIYIHISIVVGLTSQPAFSLPFAFERERRVSELTGMASCSLSSTEA